MRERATRFALLLSAIVSTGGRAAAQDDGFREAFLRNVHKGSYAVLLVDGIPTSIVSADAEAVDIRDGQWKRAKGFFDRGFASTYAEQDRLAKGDVLVVTEVFLPRGLVNRKRVSIGVRTADLRTNQGFGAVNAQAHTLFKFHLGVEPKSAADVPQVMRQIEPILRLFGNEAEARSFAAQLRQPTQTVARGDTTTDVQRKLGRPTKIVDLGAKVIWIYPDLKLTFRDGRVADVE